MLLNSCMQYPSKFGKLSSGHRTGKCQFSFQPPKRAMPRNVWTTGTIAFILHTSKVMLKILQAKLPQYTNQELSAIKLDLEKGEEPEIKLPRIIGSWRKQGNFRKISTSASLTMLKPLTVRITTNYRKFFKGWEYLTAFPVSWETCMGVKNQQLELDIEKQTGFKLGKESVKAVYCHPACLTYTQSTSCEMPGWMNYKLESRLPGEISIIADMKITPTSWLKAKRN